jgi:Rod binding domain-containing protein
MRLSELSNGQAGNADWIGSMAASPATPRLTNAAHEFEAQMMKELLKPLTTGDGLTGDTEGGGLSSSGALAEFASEALGRALSDQGGLGIADRIVQGLASRASSTSPHGAIG